MDEKVKDYIKKQKSPQKEICKKLHRIIVKTFPKIKDGMKWGVLDYGDGRYYIVALKDHVNLGFSIKGLGKDEIELFDGKGKDSVHVEIGSLKDVDEKKIVRLLKVVKG